MSLKFGVYIVIIKTNFNFKLFIFFWPRLTTLRVLNVFVERKEKNCPNSFLFRLMKTPTVPKTP